MSTLIGLNLNLGRPLVPAPPTPPVRWASLYDELPPRVTGDMEETAHRLNVAVAKLSEFTDPGQLAAFLCNQGASGIRNDTSRCVLARWLQGVVGNASITVGNGIALHYPGVMGVMRTPPMLLSFFRNFDAGMYPQLLAR